MLDKLESLKSCPCPEFEQTFNELKNTPEVKEKLDFINKLDLEINDTINRYKVLKCNFLNFLNTSIDIRWNEKSGYLPNLKCVRL